MIRKLLLSAIVGCGALAMSGCMIVQSPAMGVLFTELSGPLMVTDGSAVTKTGEATCQSIPAWIATGDCSIAAAKRAGGIKRVTHVDHRTKNILGILGEFTVVVSGT